MYKYIVYVFIEEKSVFLWKINTVGEWELDKNNLESEIQVHKQIEWVVKTAKQLS